jgi:hypothetical protein
MTKKISKRKYSGRPRPIVRLGSQLEKALLSYTTAALAASVGLIAIARSAEAKIVYTSAKIPIRVDGGPVFLDLNHDGIADFILSNFFQYATESRASFASLLVSASGVMRNQVWGRGVATSHGANRFAWALQAGYPVGAKKSRFQKSPTAVMERLIVAWRPEDSPAKPYTYCSTWPYGCKSYKSGQWLYKKNRYLGLKFVITGEIHYGWARFTVTRTSKRRGDNSITATLTGYAYETVPNKPIITGKTQGPDAITVLSDTAPGSLGRLALGKK